MAEATQTPPKAGTLCWSECMTTDAAKAKAFYTKLFGWKTNEMTMADGQTYTMFNNGEADFGGLQQLGAECVEQGAKPCWLNYIAVDDVDASAKKATSLGGTITVEPQDIPNIGRFCVLCDPTGGMIALYKSTGSC